MSMPPDCRALKYMKQKRTDLKEEKKCTENNKYVHKCKLRSYETTIILI